MSSNIKPTISCLMTDSACKMSHNPFAQQQAPYSMLSLCACAYPTSSRSTFSTLLVIFAPMSLYCFRLRSRFFWCASNASSMASWHASTSILSCSLSFQPWLLSATWSWSDTLAPRRKSRLGQGDPTSTWSPGSMPRTFATGHR